MKVVAINGSARKDGNTAILINAVADELRKEGIEVEMIQLAGRPLRGCMACYGCFRNKNYRCVINDDLFNECIVKMREADGILLGSPVYVADISPEMKALIDRACLVGRANNNFFRRKIGAAVASMRRGGAVHALDSMNHFFGIMEMVTVGSLYWNFALGREIGEVRGDEEGMRTMKALGENMAWLLKKTAQE